MLEGLRTVVYKVADLHKAREWYAEALGVAPYFNEPFYVGFSVGGYELGLLPDDTRYPAGGVTAYWGVADIDAVHARLLELGAKPHEPVTGVGGDLKVASVIDPFGNIFGIIYNPEFKVEDR